MLESIYTGGIMILKEFKDHCLLEGIAECWRIFNGNKNT